jgi:Ca2+/Na+ antiporter
MTIYAIVCPRPILRSKRIILFDMNRVLTTNLQESSGLGCGCVCFNGQIKTYEIMLFLLVLFIVIGERRALVLLLLLLLLFFFFFFFFFLKKSVSFNKKGEGLGGTKKFKKGELYNNIHKQKKQHSI